VNGPVSDLIHLVLVGAVILEQAVNDMGVTVVKCQVKQRRAIGVDGVKGYLEVILFGAGFFEFLQDGLDQRELFFFGFAEKVKWKA